ncbi:Hsp33 family molecular chaperone HslO [Aerococcus sp. 1KP-2016]|jgi:molecular chaperone Hsp33|uniref:Hsp33 family molecular chaperone HslO n=1 Tax=Aerococcus sp. 1KP-2016 TaxID=1981982 RepID=UPI000B9927CD|nr:Hsp33 family molecular chaperone HslO [Aerococcus sp. 1KP-2016]OYQ68069.1 Hsp33 family molecular chaperone [Aerococcus sp. 1KP-2016]
MLDKLVKAVALDGQVRISAVDATGVVREAQNKHDTWSASSAALGRTLVGTLLLGSDIKDDARISVQISGDGPAGKIITAVDGEGHVKGYVQNPHVSLEANDKGKIDVRGAVGTTGVFKVTKDLGLKEPFSGQVPIVSGEIAEDFTYYLAYSEQTPSAVALGVLVDTDETIINAGGWMLQLMPGATEETIVAVEQAIADIPQVTQLLSEGDTPTDMINRLFGEENVKFLDERDVAFQCDCSKERFAAGLATLHGDEITAMIEEDGGAEIVCQFCNNHYHFSADDLRAIHSHASK